MKTKLLKGLRKNWVIRIATKESQLKEYKWEWEKPHAVVISSKNRCQVEVFGSIAEFIKWVAYNTDLADVYNERKRKRNNARFIRGLNPNNYILNCFSSETILK